MTLFTPSKHQLTSFLEQDFYALSHVYGIPPNEHMWEVSDFIIDEQGTPVGPIPMRPEKRDTLLSLLKANPGRCKKCFAMIDCPPEDIEYFTLVKDQLDHALNNDSLSHETATQYLLMEALQHGRRIDVSRWFKRVWTLQEAILPTCVILLSETSGTYTHERTMLLASLIHYDDRMRELQVGDMFSNMLLPSQDVVPTDAVIGRQLELLVIFLYSLSLSKRSCYFAVDYIYGILGFLGVDIPRHDNPDVVWKHFLAYIDYIIDEMYGDDDMDAHGYSRIEVSKKAREFSLSTADNLGQVFDNLLEVNIECPCMDCSIVKYRIDNAKKDIKQRA
ncbi:hypothetical protein K492DRAFT_199652 [Lichtheimia hyalospora FSU 10163]|nr:hypothetical protein K492DRAFT_199652 [Lichtheimia hyalospora FSU 10163]